MDNCTLSFNARASGPDLTLVVRFDQQEVFRSVLGTDAQTIRHEFPDGETQDHVLEIEMVGKQPQHTRINESGEILEDRMINISNMALDGIELGQVFYQHARYHHDLNGTADPIEDGFFGDMGCNGKVVLRFSSPSYLWLLESM